MKHKHADVLIAIAEGKAVQWKSTLAENWQDYNFKSYTPITHDDLEWRIKPEPKTDLVRYIGTALDTTGMHTDNLKALYFWPNKIKLTYDGETGKLKSAEVIS